MQVTEEKKTKKQLVVATGNAHKHREIAEIFTDFEVISQKQMGFLDEVEETGTTFAENALIKARAAANALGCIALADDSGLCVDALGGAPGIYSARYAGEHGSDKANRDLLLKNMENVTDRTAYFISAIALVYPDGKELVAEGRTYGKVLYEEQGEGGFGYDCIFESDDLKKSFGLATSEEKNAVSHRFRGLQAMLKLWQEEEEK
ncbi:MAG: RdgB/HAM1 family non-canonical purine NTP pyrophosphatase [Clostridia bacterium]|nr:RdgB/HAM1 family non-canonical purine NTP pyrophosphatase [Clostridia bacterium]